MVGFNRVLLLPDPPVVRDGRLLVGEQRVVMLPALQVHPQLGLLRLVDALVEIIELHLNT